MRTIIIRDTGCCTDSAYHLIYLEDNADDEVSYAIQTVAGVTMILYTTAYYYDRERTTVLFAFRFFVFNRSLRSHFSFNPIFNPGPVPGLPLSGQVVNSKRVSPKHDDGCF